MTTSAPARAPLPPWAAELARLWNGGAHSLFLLHGNIFDLFPLRLGERPWVVSFQTGPGMVDRAIDAVLAETNRLREHGVSPEELEESRAAAIGSLVLSMEDQMGMAFVLRDKFLEDTTDDFIANLGEIIFLKD